MTGKKTDEQQHNELTEAQEELHPTFFADDSDEPTIVWVRPPRRMRSLTRQPHFLVRDAGGEIQADVDDDDPTVPEVHSDTIPDEVDSIEGPDTEIDEDTHV